MSAFDFLRWVCSDIGHFAGTLILLVVAMVGLTDIARALRGGK